MAGLGQEEDLMLRQWQVFFSFIGTFISFTETFISFIS